MSFEKFERHLLESRNPRKPAACLLILWVAAADGRLSPTQWETARKTIGSESTDLELCRALAEAGDPGALQLSCEIIRQAPPWAQLAVLTMAVRVATAPGELTLEANLALRFLCDAFDERHDLEELFPMETGHPFPDLPEGDEWWSAKEEGGAPTPAIDLLVLLGQLRSELSLAEGDWWNDRLEAKFGGGEMQGPLYPRLAKRRGGRRWRGRVLRVVLAAILMVALGWIIVAKSSRIQYGLAQKQDTVESYRVFLEKFPDSGPAPKARLRYEQLHDADTWADASESDSIEGYRSYLRQHPQGEHRSEAEKRLMRFVGGEIELAYSQWDMQGLEEIEARNAGLEVVQARVAVAMQGLRDDPGWVVLSGALPDCRSYLERNPDTPKRETLEKRIVDLEIEEIRTNDPIPVSPLTRVEAGEGTDVSAIEIRNWTSGPLVIRYGGTQSYRLVVQKGRTHTAEIKNGVYRVAVSGPGEQDRQYGEHKVEGGKYGLHFSRRPSAPGNGLRTPSR